MNKRALATTVRRGPRGFTLLEVMLGLALSALVLVAVNTAISIQLQVSNRSRGGVEEAQLARALLNRIAEDLRGAVLYQMPNPEEMTVAYAADSSGAETEEGTEDSSTEDATTTTTDETASTTEEAEEEEETGPASFPGLIGTRNELQIDTGRLPRADELAAGLTPDLAVASQLSDVKSVAYFIAQNALGGRASSSGVTGLVRQDFDRAAAAWAAENGNLSALQDAVEPLAEEVYSIEFQYYDETEIYEEWNSYDMGGLPLAVEVILYVIPAKVRQRMAAEASRSALNQPTLNSDDRLLVYRQVIRLPSARPICDETTEAETTDEEAETEDEETSAEETTSG